MKAILKATTRLVAVLLAVVLLMLAWWWPRYPYLPAPPPAFSVQRLSDRPIIHGDMGGRLAEVATAQAGEPAQDYLNINGPALIRVPAWVENPLGKYYLYFAHHKGNHIRLAYANSMFGPWRLYHPGALALEDSGFPLTTEDAAVEDRGLEILLEHFSPYIVRDLLLMSYRATVSDPAVREERGIVAATNSRPHVASPDIMIDHERQRILMYYHGLAGKVSQYTRVAESRDGLTFEPLPGEIYSNYLRVFVHRGQWYGLTMPGILYRSETGLTDFQPRKKLLFEPNMRHAGLLLEGDTLYVFWSRVGDAPERLLLSEVDLSSPDWDDWQATEPVEILRAELPWEGSELPVLPSLRGELGHSANELRDPFVFEDDGQLYLLYVGAGEQAIGLARLVPNYRED